MVGENGYPQRWPGLMERRKASFPGGQGIQAEGCSGKWLQNGQVYSTG